MNSPLALLTTVVVTVEPSFLAPTGTPSISPSSAEDTLPLRVCAFALIVVMPANSPAKLTVAKSLLDIISPLPPRIIRIGSANINSAKLIPAASCRRACLLPAASLSAVGWSVVSTGRHKSGGPDHRTYNKLLLLFGRSGRPRIVEVLQTSIGDQEIANFSQRPPITMRGSVLVARGAKEKCAAKPEDHRGNALFALSAPFYPQSFSPNVTATQKVQRMTRS